MKQNTLIVVATVLAVAAAAIYLKKKADEKKTKPGATITDKAASLAENK
jgi:hypothetical protein